jgi:hypothetical protein
MNKKNKIREIIPRYGLPLSIGSDIGPPFVEEIVQGLAKILKIKWKLHITYRPQNSGKVQPIIQTLKITLVKLCQETQSPWIDMLPLTLLRACCTPKPSGYSPFEILYGRPPPIIRAQRRPQANWKSRHVLTSPGPRKNPMPYLP